MVVIILNTICVFLGLFTIYMGFPSIKLKSTKTANRLNKIKNLGKIDFKKLKEGIGLLEPLRLLIGNKFDIEYIFESKKKKIENLGLYEKINVMDLIIIKGLLIGFLIIFSIIHLVLNIKNYPSFSSFVLSNIIQISIFYLILIFMIFIDKMIYKSIKKKRKKLVYKRLIFFINLFKTNIMSGDNLYLALDSCGREIKGFLGKEIKKTVKEFHTKGQSKALMNFSNRLNIEELTDFINIIVTGIENKHEDFAKYLTENEKVIQEIKESKEIEKQIQKPLKAILFNGLGFISVGSILLTIFTLNILKMVNQF